MELTSFHHLALALGLGMLVGLQRESAAKAVAGIRTFPLITVLGALCAMLSEPFGGWVVAAGLTALAALLFLGNLAGFRNGAMDPGLTTEVAALVMFCVGAAIASGQAGVGIAVSGGVALLLYWKQPLHDFARRIGEAEFRAIFRLVLIAFVILPVLPNRAFDPYHVINPFKIWLMVVLIVGISLGAYTAYRLIGARAGTVLGGVLGGLISSTATTVGYARRTRHEPRSAGLAAAVILIASTTVFLRVLFEIGLVAPRILPMTAPPLVVMTLFMALLSLIAFTRSGSHEHGMLEHEPSGDIGPAIVFGLLYAVVVFAVAAVKDFFGDQALYIVAALSGLTDMDAITLSTAQLVESGQLNPHTGWRLILVGAMANLVFKGAAVAALGHPALFRRVAVGFAAALLGGAALVFLWPGPLPLT